MKQCKGRNKAKDFEGCGEFLDFVERNGIKTYIQKHGLCPKCEIKWRKSTDEGRLFLARKAIKEVRKIERDKKTNWNDLLLSKAQEAARLIDYLLPCLATNVVVPTFHGGHVYSVQGNYNMRFNIHNIHRQAAMSNKSLRDDWRMREGIKDEYGENYLEFITGLKSTPITKIMIFEYKAAVKSANKFLKELRKENEALRFPRSIEERLRLRNIFNDRVNIYTKEYACYLS